MEVMEVAAAMFAQKNGEIQILPEIMALRPSLEIKTKRYCAMQKYCCQGRNVKYVPAMLQEQWLILN